MVSMNQPMSEPATKHPWGDAETPYLEIGEEAGVRRLCESFYRYIDADAPTVRAMLPREISASVRKLFMYLSGWFGGPDLYIAEYGHPRMRMRHAPFSIGVVEAEEWLSCMNKAMDECGIDGQLRLFLETQFHQLGHHMRNRD
ncbi:Hemoglobin-like protein HbO [hydrothermal vent metagenome]|uniref:Hemoglobin-like protein HbO n=1 Tax=hydrothermal vent metagenome TaxID=652676 RepID=A0A3B0T1Z5_9ZZZZ